MYLYMDIMDMDVSISKKIFIIYLCVCIWRYIDIDIGIDINTTTHIYIYIYYTYMYTTIYYTIVYISICFPRDFWKLLLPIGATSLSKSVGGKPVAVFYASQLSNALAKVSETSKSRAKQTSASSWVLLFGTASRNGAPWDILTIAVC